MIFRNPLNYSKQIFFNFLTHIKNFYLNSNLYDKKISKIYSSNFEYKPSAHLLSSLIKYQRKKYKIEDFALDSLWNKKDIDSSDFNKLNSFFWFFSLDLKSSKKTTQSVISNWIINNYKYNSKSWNFDLTSKRIIAWLSISRLSYEDSDTEYKNNFNIIIQKQANHLINQISKSKLIDDKLIGCAAIILVGLCYQNQKNYLNFGLGLLKKIIKLSLDSSGFPRSRSIKQLIFYLKYFILIREWHKESQNIPPEFIDETIYYLGQAYAFAWQNLNKDILFNGNNISNNHEFDQYLKRLGYKFKNESNNFGGYAILKNKKVILVMDVGASPNKKFSKDYQSGILSFEIISNGKKLISNSGYYKKNNFRLNQLSKSTATHSALVIEDHSSCKFEKVDNFNSSIKQGAKIIKKILFLKKTIGKLMLDMMVI